MNLKKSHARVTGGLFLIAAVASIAGLLLYGPVLNNVNYVIDGTSHQQIGWGAVFEIITAFAVIGTSVSFYPTLKKYNERMAIATVGFRIAEATVIIVGIVCLLTIITLNLQLATDVSADRSAYEAMGRLLVAFHNWTFLYGPNVLLGPSTFMTAYILYKSNIVPRPIAWLGLVGGPMILTCGTLVTLGVFEQLSLAGSMMAVPVFSYEMSLAIYLVVKGFRIAQPHEMPLQNLYKLAGRNMGKEVA